MKLNLSLLMVLLAVGQTHCSRSSGTPAGQTDEQATVLEHSEVIGAAGGSVTYAPDASGVSLELVIPPGALAADATLTIAHRSDAEFAGEVVSSLVFELSPEGLHFDSDVRLTIGYARESLPQGVNEGLLSIRKRVGTTWQVYPTSVDQAASTLTTTITGFSTWAVALLSPPVLAPDGFALQTTNSLVLSWNAVADAQTYTVYRSTTSGGLTEPLASGLSATDYTDTTALAATTYFYAVAAANAAGEGPRSGELAGSLPQPTSVLIALQDSNALHYVAQYWRDGVVTTLTDGSQDAYTYGVFAVGTDVYVIANEVISGTGEVAKLWKNGVVTPLGNGIDASRAEGLFVAGADVYVCGNSALAQYWKNGVLQTLSNGMGRGIFVNGVDVYVAGSEFNGLHDVATVWKNGVAAHLTDGLNDASAMAVVVDNADVHVAGYDGNGTNSIAMSWKNGLPTPLTTGTQNARAYAIAVDGADIYVAGFESNGTKDVAVYWKNGVATSLTNGTQTATARAISVFAGDIYVAGYESNGVKYVATYWKNGVAVQLSDGQHDAFAAALFLLH